MCLLAPMMHGTVTVLSPQRRLCVSSEDPVTQLCCEIQAKKEMGSFSRFLFFWFLSVLVLVVETSALLSAEENLFNV